MERHVGEWENFGLMDLFTILIVKQLPGCIHMPNILKYRVYYVFFVCQLYHNQDIFKKEVEIIPKHFQLLKV